jgi:hypothetical protein
MTVAGNGRSIRPQRGRLGSCMLGALILLGLSACSALEMRSGHAKLQLRIEKLQAKTRALDQRGAVPPARPASASGGNG